MAEGMSPDRFNSVISLTVGVQNNYCAGGTLEVPDANEVIAPINQVNRYVRGLGGDVCFSRDWVPRRPKDSRPQCYMYTTGAAFPDALEVYDDDIIVNKGGPKYSAFSERTQFDNLPTPYDNLPQYYMDDLDPMAIVIAGLPTNRCVKSTVLDALDFAKEGRTSRRVLTRNKVFVVEDAIRANDPDAGAQAVAKMQKAGARFVTSQDIVTGGVFKIVSLRSTHF